MRTSCGLSGADVEAFEVRYIEKSWVISRFDSKHQATGTGIVIGGIYHQNTLIGISKAKRFWRVGVSGLKASAFTAQKRLNHRHLGTPALVESLMPPLQAAVTISLKF